MTELQNPLRPRTGSLMLIGAEADPQHPFVVFGFG